MPKLLLITGASGFMGYHALNFVLNSNAYDWIIATDMKSPELDHPLRTTPQEILTRKRINFLTADITYPKDIAVLQRILGGAVVQGFDIYVWHMGGCFSYSAPRELLYKVNVLGTEAVLEILASIASWYPTNGYRIRRLVFWSGGIVYGDFNHPQGILPATENYPVSPKNEYAWSKKEAEDRIIFYHRKLGVPVTIMRLAGIYGPYSRYGMGAGIILQARGQLEPVIVGSGDNKTAMIHAEDVARVANFLESCPEANGEIYNVVDNTSITLGEQSMFLGELLDNRPFRHFRMPSFVFRFLARLTQIKAAWLEAEPIIDPGLSDVILLNSWMSNAKLMKLAEKYEVRKTLLKYPDTFDGLRQTVGWFKKEGWL